MSSSSELQDLALQGGGSGKSVHSHCGDVEIAAAASVRHQYDDDDETLYSAVHSQQNSSLQSKQPYHRPKEHLSPPSIDMNSQQQQQQQYPQVHQRPHHPTQMQQHPETQHQQQNHLNDIAHLSAAVELGDADDDSVVVANHSFQLRPVKIPRRRYDNYFKSKVLQHLKIPGVKLSTVAKKFQIPENTLREWTKVSAVRAIEVAKAKNSGQLKANMYDPLHRVATSLKLFFDNNERQPQHLRQPVTTKLIVAKGLEAKANLLELDRVQPMLEAKEKNALELFTGSDSWAKKFAKRHQLKMSGARIKDLSDEEIREYQSTLNQMASRIRQAGPAWEDVACMLRQAGEKLQRSSGAMAKTSATYRSVVSASGNDVQNRQHTPPSTHHFDSMLASTTTNDKTIHFATSTTHNMPSPSPAPLPLPIANAPAAGNYAPHLPPPPQPTGTSPFAPPYTNSNDGEPEQQRQLEQRSFSQQQDAEQQQRQQHQAWQRQPPTQHHHRLPQAAPTEATLVATPNLVP